jgi:hypothetical protein
MRFLFALLSLALVPGCATVPDSRVTFAKPGSGEIRELPREALVGTWFGSQPTTDGTTKEWITRRTADGQFQVSFREIRNGRVTNESIEEGEWGLSYDCEIVITRGWVIDGRFQPAPADAYFWDIYQIEHIDGQGLTYLHRGTGHRYHVRRVSSGFQFPAPASIFTSTKTNP